METKKKYINLDIKSFGMIAALIIIFVIFYVMTKGSNATPTNINNLIMQNGYIIILATGMLLCVLTGYIDLGVGSVVALGAACAAKLVVEQGWAVPLAWLVAVGIGLAIGIFAGFFIAYLDIPPFVVTLATMLMGRGLTYTLLKSLTVGPLPADYSFIGVGFLPTVKIAFGDGQIDLVCLIVAAVVSVGLIFSEMKTIRTNNKYGFANLVPWQMIIKDVVILVIVWFFFTRLEIGRAHV